MSTSSNDSPNHPTGPGPKNQPSPDAGRHVDDDLTPRPFPDDPSHTDSRSPAEKAYDDFGPPDADADAVDPP